MKHARQQKEEQLFGLSGVSVSQACPADRSKFSVNVYSNPVHTAHPFYNLVYRDAEVDKLMQEEKQTLEELRKRGLTVRIDKDGKTIMAEGKAMGVLRKQRKEQD